MLDYESAFKMCKDKSRSLYEVYGFVPHRKRPKCLGYVEADNKEMAQTIAEIDFGPRIMLEERYAPY